MIAIEDDILDIPVKTPIALRCGVRATFALIYVSDGSYYAALSTLSEPAVQRAAVGFRNGQPTKHV